MGDFINGPTPSSATSAEVDGESWEKGKEIRESVTEI